MALGERLNFHNEAEVRLKLWEAIDRMDADRYKVEPQKWEKAVKDIRIGDILQLQEGSLRVALIASSGWGSGARWVPLLGLVDSEIADPTSTAGIRFNFLDFRLKIGVSEKILVMSEEKTLQFSQARLMSSKHKNLVQTRERYTHLSQDSRRLFTLFASLSGLGTSGWIYFGFTNPENTRGIIVSGSMTIAGLASFQAGRFMMEKAEKVRQEFASKFAGELGSGREASQIIMNAFN